MENSKNKKIVMYSLLGLDVAVTIFLFVVSILMIATQPNSPAVIDDTTFIGFFQANPTVFLLAIVLPLVLLLGVNVFILIRFIRKTGAKKKTVSDLTTEQKEALRKELMNDLANEDKKE